MPGLEEREVLTYELFGDAVRELTRQVRAGGYRPDLVLAIARGGLGLGMALGYALDVKHLAAVNVEFYTGIDQRLAEPVLLPPAPSATDLQGLRVLVTDDVADTGETLAFVQKFCAGYAAEARSAVLYTKPHSVVQPDFSWRRTDRWISFPWSSGPPVTGH